MSGVIQNFFQTSLYKRNQGRVARQVTFGAVAVASVLGAYRISQMDWSTSAGGFLTYGLPALVVAVCCWIAWRLVQLPSFADFLISVEAEMAKVSWPSWSEVFRSSVVVIFVMFAIAAALFIYDTVFVKLLTSLVY